MAIKTLRVFQEFTSEGYVPMPVAGNIDYGVTVAGTFPGTTPSTYQTDDPDIDVTVTTMTDFYVWIRSHGAEWNINYTRNVRVYPDSPLINNVVMGIIIANLGDTVPYTGATENVDLGEFGLSGGFLHLDNTPTLANVPTTPGTLVWNDAEGTADLLLKGGNVTLQLGQEEVLRVVNKTGATLNEADFRAVRIRSVAEGGAQGQRLAVVLAQGDNDPDSATTIGLVTETILNNEEGFITTGGNVNKINTTGAKSYGGSETWVDGDVLYLSPTHPGYLTKVKPQAPDHTIIIGWVVYAHANNGKIFVKVDNGYELDELHNVKITTPTNGQGLVYDSALSVWKNQTIATSLTANAPLSITSNVISISQATSTTNGYLSSSDWVTFNSKQGALSLTTSGASGASTLVGNTLNIPDYSLIGLGGVPTSRTLTINGTTYDLSSDRTWSVGSVTSVSATVPNGFAISGSPITTSGTLAITFASGYSLPTDAKQAQWDVAYNKRIDTAQMPLQIDSNIISIYQSSPTSNGYLSSTDWTTFNNKQSALNGIGFVKANGTSISYDNTDYAPTTRTLTINGTTFDLSANRTWTIGSDLTASAPLSITSGVISISQSSATTNGFLSSTDWTTFNSKQSALSGTGFVKISGTTISYDNSTYTPTSRTLSINGTSYDLSADRSWTITPGSGMRNISTFTATSGQTTFTIVGGYTVGLVDVFVNGTRLSNADFVATNGTSVTLGVGVVANDIVDIVNYVAGLTDGVTGSGTLNYLPKFSSTSNLTNSLIFDNGTNIGIGTITPSYKLDVSGDVNITGTFRVNGVAIGIGSGSVTSVAATVPTGFAISGSPITTSGTLAITFASGYSLPTNASQTNWDTAYTSRITSASSPLSIISNVISISQANTTTNGFLSSTDWNTFNNKQSTITLTTTGTSGAATLVGNTLNIPQYQTSITNPVTGTGTVGYLTKWGTTSSIANSLIFENSNSIGIGTTSPNTYDPSGNNLVVYEAGNAGITIATGATNFGSLFFARETGTAGAYRGYIEYGQSADYMGFGTVSAERMRITSAGRVGINTTSPQAFLHVSDGNTGTKLMIEDTYGGNGRWGLGAGIGGLNDTHFTLRHEISSTTVLTATPSGNIGIGVLNPSAKLEVNGTLWTASDMFTYPNGGIFFNGLGAYTSGVYARDGGANLILQAGSAERMRIISDGSVAIGSTTRANVWGLLTLRNSLNSSTQRWGIGPDTNNSLTVYNPSNVGVYITDGGTSWTANSDINLKNIENYIENALESINDLSAIRFNWKNDSNKKSNIGLIAQEVQKVYPELIDKNSEGYLGVRYTELIPILVQAIKELNAKLEAK